MAGKNKKKKLQGNIAAQNRKARHDYYIESKVEAGIMLTGSEVKSLREGKATIGDSYAAEVGGELFLFNAHIPEYAAASRFGHEPRRRRKLLLHKRELARMLAAVAREGMTLVPLSIYFNDQGRAKVELALAKGKLKADKRASIKEREWKRKQSRLLHTKD